MLLYGQILCSSHVHHVCQTLNTRLSLPVKIYLVFYVFYPWLFSCSPYVDLIAFLIIVVSIPFFHCPQMDVWQFWVRPWCKTLYCCWKNNLKSYRRYFGLSTCLISSYSDCCVFWRIHKSVEKNSKLGPFLKLVVMEVLTFSGNCSCYIISYQTDLHMSWNCWSLLLKFIKVKLVVLF